MLIIVVWVANSVDPDQGLHCLLRCVFQTAFLFRFLAVTSNSKFENPYFNNSSLNAVHCRWDRETI